MQVNGTLINYYFHCRRQCYLHGNRLNLEDNSEQVKIGKAIHEEKAGDSKNSEIAIDNIRLDRLTKEYLTEVKKSDADTEAAKWQLLFYLKVLKSKGIIRKGMILSRLVDTFFSRISPTMQLPPKHHSIAYVLPWAEGLHWQSRSSGCSNS